MGMQAEDILVCARWLREEYSKDNVKLIAVGNVGITALHSAALEPDLFNNIEILNSLDSWSNIIENGLSQNQLAFVVHGALKVYDLPYLAKTLGNRLTVTAPVDSLRRPAGQK